MATRKLWINISAAVVGAIVGASLGGVMGAIAGAGIASVMPFAFEWGSTRAQLKRQIVRVLTQHGPSAIAVRDVMKTHGVTVPTDCLTYDENDPFVKALAEYRAAFSELEGEHRIVHNKQASIVVGYVDAPNDWVNEWSGRAYQQVPARHR